MGLDINSVQFLIAAHNAGVEFHKTLTIGRQDLNVFPKKMMELFSRKGISSDELNKLKEENLYADIAFQLLGANEVLAMDASGFEGAEIIHDLNVEVPRELHQSFDVVYDGGTLEHIFDFPRAIKNCMEMVKEGGRLFIHTVSNNYCGHGFYQFSPELFFRTLCRDNGFKIERMVLHAMGPYGSWYEVSDPEEIRERVELMTILPVQLLIQAQRMSVVPMFKMAPQQSDYTPRWTDRQDSPRYENSQNVNYAPPRPKLAKILPGVARLVNAIKTGVSLLRSHTLRNKKRFKRVPKR